MPSSGCFSGAWSEGCSGDEPAEMPRLHEAALNGQVLFFSLGLSLVTGVLFGLMPAFPLRSSIRARL